VKNSLPTEEKFGTDTILWDLKELFDSPEDPRITQTLSETKAAAKNFHVTYKGKLATLSPQALREAYNTLISIVTPLYKVSQYASLGWAANTADTLFKSLVSRVDDAEAIIANEFVFFELELGQIPDEKANEFSNSPHLKPYLYEMHLVRISAKHQLTEAEERIINLKDVNGVDALQKLYQDITSSYQFKIEIDGEEKTLNGSQLRQLRLHANPELRQKAMHLFFQRYKENEIIFGHLYNHIAKDYVQETSLRGYNSVFEAKVKSADLPFDVVNILHQVTSESNTLVQRYYAIKKQLINLPELTLSDIYAPLPASDSQYSWEEAKAIILKSFGHFDKEIADMAKRMFDNNRIHAPVSPTKRGGAFCSSSTPDIDPYVLVNFLGKTSDVTTLAHELGHAIHDMLCSKQHLLDYHPVLPLAETASVFAEMLVTDALLQQNQDPKTQIALISDKLEEMFATSHRQNMFSCFEINAFDAIGKDLQSSEDLCKIYAEGLSKMFGDSVRITPEYHWEWASIPHIFESPFYVYAYNFGNLLVMALYQKYLEEGPSFVPKYKAMLAAGRAASPTEIAALADLDLSDPHFWKKGIQAIEGWVSKLEVLVRNHHVA
jgi:oligoendopeptidase F